MRSRSPMGGAFFGSASTASSSRSAGGQIAAQPRPRLRSAEGGAGVGGGRRAQHKRVANGDQRVPWTSEDPASLPDRRRHTVLPGSRPLATPWIVLTLRA
jgi:hypothetical protein